MRKYSLKFHKRVHNILSIPIEWTHHCTLPLARRGTGLPDVPKGAQRHKRMDCKDQFISEVADTAAHKIARQVIMTLQRRKEARPSRDDAGWANRWDEGGMPMHGEASAVWERDAERIKQCITEEVRTHP